jgi:hypothetical protein
MNVASAPLYVEADRGRCASGSTHIPLADRYRDDKPDVVVADHDDATVTRRSLHTDSGKSSRYEARQLEAIVGSAARIDAAFTARPMHVGRLP